MKTVKLPDYFVVDGLSIWLTGLPGSGKTTIAHALHQLCNSHLVPCVVLDGDIIRPLIAFDLGTSEEDRLKSLTRYLKLCSILLSTNIIVIVAVINHSEKQRQYARSFFPEKQYIEVWINTPLEVCMDRDPKGLYRRAIKGENDNMVGVSIQFEPPSRPDITIETIHMSAEQAAHKIFSKLITEKFLIPNQQVLVVS